MNMTVPVSMIQKILHEITPLKPDESFSVFSREKKSFDFPLHYHEELELNLIVNGKGAKRIVGDHVEAIGEIELVLLGSNLPHGWFTGSCSADLIREVTIQFDKNLFSESLLRRTQLEKISDLFNRANKGILFSKETATELMTKILDIKDKSDFNLVLELFSILHQLSLSSGQQTLSALSFSEERVNYQSRRVERVLDYISQNFHRHINLRDVSRIANMEPGSFSHFIRKKTGSTFMELLNEVRLRQVLRMLIETDRPVEEIAFKCGFHDLTSFNQTFMRKKGCTPVDFKHNYEQNQLLI